MFLRMMRFWQLPLIVLLHLHLRVSAAAAAAVGSNQWDHFVYAQQWPITSCIAANISHDHDCHIPDNVTTWTVHGLWPSEKASQSPQFCNTSSHDHDFDPDSLSEILPTLVQFWPNLYRDTGFYNFWKHEWCKHGTCAITLEAVNSELKYFQKGIELRKKFDLLSILSDSGIKPSDDTTYEYIEFTNALEKGLGARPLVSCVYDKETKTQYIAQAEFCIDKNFDVINCPKRGSLYFVPNAARARQTRGLEYRAIESLEQRKFGNRESCEQRFAFDMNRRSPESPCRDTETIAYPVIKHF